MERSIVIIFNLYWFGPLPPVNISPPLCIQIGMKIYLILAKISAQLMVDINILISIKWPIQFYKANK